MVIFQFAMLVTIYQRADDRNGLPYGPRGPMIPMIPMAPGAQSSNALGTPRCS